MNKRTSLIKYIVFLSLLMLYIGFSLVLTEQKAALVRCQDIHLITKGNQDNQFVNQQDITNLINRHKLNIIGYPIEQVNDLELENLLKQQQNIKNAEVYKDLKGNLFCKIEQREPIIRIIQKDNFSYYIDQDGLLMPWSKAYTPHIPVVTGITSIKRIKQKVKTKQSVQKDTTLNRLFLLAKSLYKRPFWYSACNQISINHHNDISLWTKLGVKEIVLGTDNDFNDDFKTLDVFYKDVLPQKGWNRFRKINLKYKGQIVCSEN